LEAAIRARDLDEVSPVLNNRLAVAYLWSNDNLRAAEQFAIAAQLGFTNAVNGGYPVFLLRLQRYNEFKAIMAALHHNSPNPPTWLIEHADTVFLPGNRDEGLKMAMLAKQEGNFSIPRFEFALWITVGGIDQAYERFNALRESKHQYLQLEFVFSEEGREFRQDPRFEQLTADIGLQEYWDTYGDPDTD